MPRSHSSSNRDDAYQIRKDVQAELAYIRVHLIGSETLAVVTNGGEPRGLSQRELSKRVGLSQPEVGRLLRGECAPHPKTRQKIHDLYLRARSRHWGAEVFFPICAFAERGNCHMYRPDLPAKMMSLLHETLDSEPIVLVHPAASNSSLSLDLHIRASKLPDGIEAYSFGNDRNHPNVFVVLVNRKFNYVDQCEKAWDEVLAHVARIPAYRGNVVPISQPVMRHFQPGNIQ